MTTMHDDDDLVAVKASSEDRFGFADHIGSLLLINVFSHEENILTSASTEPTEAVRANVDVLDGTGKGEHFEDALLFGRAVVAKLKQSVGKKVVGIVGQGAKKPGKNPAWVLNEPSDSDMATARAFIAGGSASSSRSKSSSEPPF